jgi:hypothetical protein
MYMPLGKNIYIFLDAKIIKRKAFEGTDIWAKYKIQ